MYYKQKQYRRKRLASTISNALWRLVMTVITLIIVALCAYGCYNYVLVMAERV
jgi:hypothetical protein